MICVLYFCVSIVHSMYYSAGPCRYHFTMTNRGRRTHQLYWTTEGFPQFRKRQTLPSLKPTAIQCEPPEPTFRLQPSRMELHPGQSIDVILEGTSDIPKVRNMEDLAGGGGITSLASTKIYWTFGPEWRCFNIFR